MTKLRPIAEVLARLERIPSSALVRCAWILVISASGGTLEAQRDLKDIPPPDVAAELSAFRLGEGLEISLYAADPAVSKPIHMNFDSAGRLWVVCSPLYPHIAPGDLPQDRIVVLEDRDDDGRAEISTTFADDLLMPTGIEIGDGGVYVANSHEILHLTDTDHDGRADRRRVVLSGFGTEDTHHLIHTFRWGPEGFLYFNQSIYIHSHVETPWGVRRMNGGGIWRFRTDTLSLEPFLYGMCNPWGHQLDAWGQNIGTDGAGYEGIQYLIPGATCRHSPRSDPILAGLNPGSPKYCGLDIVESSHFGEEWHGHLVTNDFRAQGVCRFVLRDNGSGFSAHKLEDVVRSTHIAFRPIDTKLGPDGALYIADWYNPIIQHGEVSFRDERRNRANGRIWRVTRKGSPVLANPRLDLASVPQLVDQLASRESWNRHFAKRELAARPRAEVSRALSAWVSRRDPGSSAHEHELLEALWLRQTIDETDVELLDRLLAASEPRARAAAVRVLSYWPDRIGDPLPRLSRAIADPFARVRLEAVRALARVRNARAAELAVLAIDAPMDSFIDYALALTLRELAAVWVPALERGEIDFGGAPHRLEYALRAAGSPRVATKLLELSRSASVADRDTADILVTVAAVGEKAELEELGRQALELSAKHPLDGARVFDALRGALERLGERIEIDAERLRALCAVDRPELARAALDLAGTMGLDALRPEMETLASDAPTELRASALRALARLGGDASRGYLIAAAQREKDDSDDALGALVWLEPERAAAIAVERLARTELPPERVDGIISAFLTRDRGSAALAAALPRVRLEADRAKEALRALRDSGLEVPALAAALRSAGSLPEEGTPPSPAEFDALLADAAARGDARHGQEVFRRDDLRCVGCHAIGGAGGKVGPDLSTLGASAQPDYILDALLDPPKAIKEGFHAVTVITKRGDVHTGVRVRQNPKETVLRLADDREVRISAAEIADEAEAGSIMPRGLDEPLTRAEFVDLIAFLCGLGKPGSGSLPNPPYLRSWEVLEDLPPPLLALDPSSRVETMVRDAGLPWKPRASRVSGALPLTASNARTIFLRSAIDVTSAGDLGLEFETSGAAPPETAPPPEILRVWINGKAARLEGNKTTVNAPIGRLSLWIEVSSPGRGDLRVQLLDVARSTARARPALDD
jgi:putative heme-binding domain-containing protein